MNNNNQKKVISAGDLKLNFDDRALYDLCQKLFKDEITFEEFKEKAHELVVDRIEN